MDRLQVLGEVTSTETALFHQAAAASYGLGITDMKTVSILRTEGPMAAGQLAERLSLTTGAVTNVIDRLEQRGLVRRQADEKDRRRVIVVLNSAALTSVGNAYDSMGKSFERLLAAYSTEELAFLVRHYEASLELTKQEIARLRVG
ncbi:MAG TPA: MarR family transcriptional regulator [Rectinemataceae bacterium]|nr:MarR family transcriptional regulator [Rectinemataceae bacterium]